MTDELITCIENYPIPPNWDSTYEGKYENWSRLHDQPQYIEWYKQFDELAKGWRPQDDAKHFRVLEKAVALLNPHEVNTLFNQIHVTPDMLNMVNSDGDNLYSLIARRVSRDTELIYNSFEILMISPGMELMSKIHNVYVEVFPDTTFVQLNHNSYNAVMYLVQNIHPHAIKATRVSLEYTPDILHIASDGKCAMSLAGQFGNTNAVNICIKRMEELWEIKKQERENALLKTGKPGLYRVGMGKLEHDGRKYHENLLDHLIRPLIEATQNGHISTVVYLCEVMGNHEDILKAHHIASDRGYTRIVQVLDNKIRNWFR
jgi:hypothetical protein